MSTPLKNRLVGTIIVVALAVILLPDFLDGKKESRAPLFDAVLTAPAKKPIVNPEPFPSERVQAASHRPIEIVEATAEDDALALQEDILSKVETGEKAAQSQDQPTVSELASQTVVKPPTQKQEGAGWIIQLGSFRHEKNVKLLLDKLEKAGYRAFSRPIQTRSGTLTKVFVGPDLSKQKLDASLPHLKQLTGLNGRVTRFTIEP